MNTVRVLIKVTDEKRTLSGVLKVDYRQADMIENLIMSKISAAVKTLRTPRTCSQLVDYFSHVERFHIGAEVHERVVELDLVKGTFKLI